MLFLRSVRGRALYRAGPLVGLSVGLSFGPGRVETFNPIILSGRVGFQMILNINSNTLITCKKLYNNLFVCI